MFLVSVETAVHLPRPIPLSFSAYRLYFPFSLTIKWDHTIGWGMGRSNVHHSQARPLKSSKLSSYFPPAPIWGYRPKVQIPWWVVDIVAKKGGAWLLYWESHFSLGAACFSSDLILITVLISTGMVLIWTPKQSWLFVWVNRISKPFSDSYYINNYKSKVNQKIY